MKANLRIGSRGVYVVGNRDDLQAWPGDSGCRPATDGRILHFSRFIEPADEESKVIAEYVVKATALLDEMYAKIRALRQEATKTRIEEVHRSGPRTTVVLRGQHQTGQVLTAYGHQWRLLRVEATLEEPGEHASRSSGLGKTYLGDGEYRWLAVAEPEVAQ